MMGHTMRVMRTPKSVDLEITGRCNLRCAYCSHFGSAGDVAQDLPAEEWLRFFEELNRCAVTKVNFGGGEPFCRPDLKELIAGAVKNRMRFGILSNGTLISRQMADFLASSSRCDGVQVSIDGSIPLTHDVFRGRGTFHRAMNGIHTLRQSGVPVSVRVTVHRKNIHDLEAIAALLIDKMGLPGFSINSASHMGLCRRNAEQIQLTAAERSTAMEVLLRLNHKYEGRIGATAGPLAEGRDWLEMERARRDGRGMPGRGFLAGCGGPLNQLAVRADGIMVPCGQLPHVALGRINRNDLQELWQNHPELRSIRQRRTIPLSRFAFCQGCEYIPSCTGNCPATAYTLTGEVNHPGPDACFRRFLQEGGRLPHGELPD